MKHTMRTTKTIAIALVALAASAGTQTAQAHGKEEKEYVENLFAIAWFESKDTTFSFVGNTKEEHQLYLMHWKNKAWSDHNFAELPIAGRPVYLFDTNKKYLGSVPYGRFRLGIDDANRLAHAVGQNASTKITFYLQMSITPGQRFDAERAMKLELFPNRLTAIITIHDGFRRMVPVQRYSVSGQGAPLPRTHQKEPPTAINFGPLK